MEASISVIPPHPNLKPEDAQEAPPTEKGPKGKMGREQQPDLLQMLADAYQEEDELVNTPELDEIIRCCGRSSNLKPLKRDASQAELNASQPTRQHRQDGASVPIVYASLEGRGFGEFASEVMRLS
jgi:hypothetical protein